MRDAVKPVVEKLPHSTTQTSVASASERVDHEITRTQRTQSEAVWAMRAAHLRDDHAPGDQRPVVLHDAIKAMPFPLIGVHMSNIAAREPWRAHSIISPAVKGTVQGLGPHSYLTALRGLHDIVKSSAT